MKRAHRYFWTMLQADQHEGTLSPPDVDEQTMRELYFAGRRERQAEMEAAIGVWVGRSDLSDVGNYLRILREDDRSERLLPI